MAVAKAFSEAFEQRFALEYLKDLNGTQAVIRAGGTGTLATSGTRASSLLCNPRVQALIHAGLAERNARVKVEADDVLREVLAIATCDTNEIVEIRRTCCRNCHGEGFRHQYVDDRELSRARSAFKVTEVALVEEFEHGGLGFDPQAGPNEDCPWCGGEGTAHVHVKDTRSMSPAARSLFAGAKQTREGIDVRLHSKDKALEMLARHLGLLNDRLKIDTSDLDERILRARKRVGR
jgi:phage terminase small subunit